MSEAAEAEAKPVAGAHRLWIGTSNPSSAGGDGPGIYAAYFHEGELSQPVMVEACVSPSFLAVRRGQGNPLYAVLGGDAAGNGTAASYALSSSDERALQPIASASTGGQGGCHISVSADGKTVLVANYSGGSVASFRADEAGHLTQASVVAFAGTEHGPYAERQDKAYAHAAEVSPDGDFVFVNDLGLDRIHVFALDRATSKLLPHKPDHWASAAGAGPRHLVCHPNGKWVYCINELNSTIDQLQWAPTHGVLTTRSTVSTLPAGVDYTGKRACEVIFSRDMRFLYAANRIHESFAVFAIDGETGGLTHVQEMPNPGRESRHMTLDPSGKWLLSANQFSGDISVFPLDTATGKLGARVSQVQIAGPSCLVFA